MPARRNPVPSYLHHKPSGRAYVKIRRADGSRQTIYLGPWDTPESRAEYARVLAGHNPPATPDTVNPVVAPEGPITVTELILRFLEHAETYYRRPDGTHTNEVAEYRLALRPARFLFGALPATEFGPKALKAVRNLMVEGYEHPDYGSQGKLSRGVVNQRVGRIVRAFKWSVAEELVPVAVHQALATVPGLKAGRCHATETEPVEPVAWEVVEKTLAHLNSVVRAMVLLMWHTGCRPGEACSIKASEIDRSGKVWLYRPGYHKLAYRGKPRVVAIGKQAQAALTPFLDRPGFLFAPAQAAQAVRAKQMANRTTKRFPCEDRRSQRRRKAKPQKKPGEKYTTPVLCRAIERAAERAGVEHWHPNQLRHAFATRVRAAFGLEEAQTALGHAHAAITEVYAERNQALAIKVADALG